MFQRKQLFPWGTGFLVFLTVGLFFPIAAFQPWWSATETYQTTRKALYYRNRAEVRTGRFPPKLYSYKDEFDEDCLIAVYYISIAATVAAGLAFVLCAVGLYRTAISILRADTVAPKLVPVLYTLKAFLTIAGIANIAIVIAVMGSGGACRILTDYPERCSSKPSVGIYLMIFELICSVCGWWVVVRMK